MTALRLKQTQSFSFRQRGVEGSVGTFVHSELILERRNTYEKILWKKLIKCGQFDAVRPLEG